MPAIQMVIGLLLVVVLIAWLAAKLKLPYPILLVIGGLSLSFVDGLPRAVLAPDIISLILLPPLVFYAALLTSWRDFKANSRPITLLAVGLVVATTLVVAVACKWFIPGFTWATAFVLGAILSPTDTIAAVAIAQRLKVPKRVIVTLETESMMNDAAGLVVYRLALAAVLAGSFSAPRAAGSLLFVSAGGIVVGLLAGMLIAWIRPRMKDLTAETAGSLLAPYIAYLPADALGVSTVLALCTAGVYLSRKLPTVGSAQSRLRIFAAWDAFIFLLNGAAFILIGLNLPVIVGSLSPHYSNAQLMGYAALVTAVAIAVRVWGVFFVTALVRRFAILSRGQQDQQPQPWKVTFVVAWTGMRGVVSLAAALGVPVMARGEPFPNRDLIIFITFGVILGTLVLQGLSLPFIIRMLGLEADDQEDQEELTARHAAAMAAMERLAAIEAQGSAPSHLVERTRAAYDDRIQYLVQRIIDGAGEPCTLTNKSEHLTRDLLGAERQAIILLRDRDMISDETLRRLQEELDLQESHLTA